MTTEWRPETCSDCGASREREWVIRQTPKSDPVPAGSRREHSSGFWTTVATPTRWHTLCLCDTP